MPTIGKLEEYSDSKEDWESYIEIVEQYFAINDVQDEKCVPALIACMGSAKYSLLKNLLAPDKPSTKTYKDIVDILTAHLCPKPLVIAERYRFYKHDQTAEESVSQYIAVIKTFSSK